MVVTVARAEVRSNSFLNNFLIERGVWSFKKQICQNLHAESFIWILRKLIAKETYA
jgi:hypothetical protein